MTISYSPIAGQITLRADVSELSGRDKAQLFRTLVDAAKLDPANYDLPFNQVYQMISTELWEENLK